MPFASGDFTIPPCPKCGATSALPISVEAASGLLLIELRCDTCGHRWRVSHQSALVTQSPAAPDRKDEPEG